MRRLAAGLALALAVIVAVAAPASAHASLLSCDPAADSLNVSAAAAIFLYHFTRAAGRIGGSP